MGSTPPWNVTGEKSESTHEAPFQAFGAYPGFPQQPPRPILPDVSPSTRRYLETLELAPCLKELLGDGKLVNHLGTIDNSPVLVHTASDYSYSADRYAGDGWRLIGDAGGEQWKKLAPLLY